jgi:hypothetical protein
MTCVLDRLITGIWTNTVTYASARYAARSLSLPPHLCMLLSDACILAFALRGECIHPQACSFCPARFDSKLACPSQVAAATATGGRELAGPQETPSTALDATTSRNLAGAAAAKASEDSSTLRCEPFCAMAHATAHCKLWCVKPAALAARLLLELHT